MTESEIKKKLERNLAENDSYKEEERSADDTGNNLGEEVGDIFIGLEVDEGFENFEEEEVAFIEEIVEMLERRKKDRLPALRDISKKKLLGETAKVDKVFHKFKGEVKKQDLRAEEGLISVRIIER